MTYDLILRGGRVIDPSQRIDGVMDVAFSGGKVAKVAPKLEGDAKTDVRDVSRARSSRRASSTCTPTSTGAAPRSASTRRSSAAPRA